jgi:hypothetical protein
MTGEWPPSEVDHRDLDKGNNRWTNLRIASSAGNKWNLARRSSNTTGYKGVSRKRSKFQAQIAINKKRVSLGCFASPEEAYAAYCKAASEWHGEFARYS